jgi:hypothetical protein
MPDGHLILSQEAAKLPILFSNEDELRDLL